MEISWFFDVIHIYLSTIAFIVTSYVVAGFVTRRRGSYPPGPTSWPLLGSLPYLARLGLTPLQLLNHLPEKYGDIAFLRVLGIDVVVLSDYNVIKEAFHRVDFSSRPEPVYSRVAGRHNFGLVSSSGQVSREQRQIAHSFFRTFGVGKSQFEAKISEEIVYLTEEFTRQEGRPFNPKKALNNAVSNIICAVVFGSRHEYNDYVFNALQEAVNSNLAISKSGGLFFFLPTLARIPFTPGYNINRNVSCIITQVNTFYKEHCKDYKQNRPRDMIDMYIDKMQEEKKGRASLSYDETNMLFTLADTFSGGTETTTTALSWLLLHMIDKPDIQSRVQSELDSVVGRQRLPTLADRSSLPYTEATILETQRISVTIPLGVPHQYRGQGDGSLGGYGIPEGALVIANYWRLSRDPRIWDDPETFNPERFLNEEGKCVKPAEMIPFSIGKRVCIGESLAKMELFLVFSSLLHRFTLTAPDGVISYPMDGELGAVYVPPPHQICAVPRGRV